MTLTRIVFHDRKQIGPSFTIPRQPKSTTSYPRINAIWSNVRASLLSPVKPPRHYLPYLSVVTLSNHEEQFKPYSSLSDIVIFFIAPRTWGGFPSTTTFVCSFLPRPLTISEPYGIRRTTKGSTTYLFKELKSTAEK